MPPLSFQEVIIVHSRSFSLLFVPQSSLMYCMCSVFEDFEELNSEICPEDLKAFKLNEKADGEDAVRVAERARNKSIEEEEEEEKRKEKKRRKGKGKLKQSEPLKRCRYQADRKSFAEYIPHVMLDQVGSFVRASKCLRRKP